MARITLMTNEMEGNMINRARLNPFGQFVGFIVSEDAKCRLKLFERCAIAATFLWQSFVLGFCCTFVFVLDCCCGIGMYSSRVVQTT